MPESIGKSIELLHAEIVSQWKDTSRISPYELGKRFPQRQNLASAWYLNKVLQEYPYDLIVCVDKDFPWSLPLIVLPDCGLNGAFYPHVESDGFLCIIPAMASFELPVGIKHIEYLIQEADDLLQKGRTGANESDFYVEAESYWRLGLKRDSEFWLVTQPPESHAVWTSLVVGKNFVIAPDKPLAQSWLKNSGRQTGVSHQSALILRLPTPLHPKDYPLIMRDLFSLIHKVGASAQIKRALSECDEKTILPVLIVFNYQLKTIILGGGFLPPGHIRMYGTKHYGISGFRSLKQMPYESRLNALSKVSEKFPRLKVVPVYKEYLQERTAGTIASELDPFHVIIAGCGALGGQLAIQLSQAGVGRLTLLDQDFLDWRNVGRHVLDGSFVGRNKAEAIAESILRRFPDARVKGFSTTWEKYFQPLPKNDYADLMISVTGEVAGNRHLDALVKNGQVPPVLFGWIEPFGVAAHAIFRHPKGGSLAEISDNTGLLKEPVADLRGTPPLPQEASCGAFYQPYSSVSALPCIATIGELALDVLFKRIQYSVHRVWVSNSEAFSRNGLSIHPSWLYRLNSMGFNRRYDFMLPGKDV